MKFIVTLIFGFALGCAFMNWADTTGVDFAGEASAAKLQAIDAAQAALDKAK